MGWGQWTGPLLPRVPAGRAAQEEGRGLTLHFSGQHPGLREGPAPRVLPVWEVKSWATLSGGPHTVWPPCSRRQSQMEQSFG